MKEARNKSPARKHDQFIHQVLGKLCERLFRGILAFLGYLGYATTIRAFIISYYGFYWAGITDGTIIVTTLIVTIVYVYALALLHENH